jgi:hypothetical protein
MAAILTGIGFRVTGPIQARRIVDRYPPGRRIDQARITRLP